MTAVSPPLPPQLSPADLERLRTAKHLLEDISFAAKITNVVGVPIEKGLELLPASWQAVVHETTRQALAGALSVAVRSLGSDAGPRLEVSIDEAVLIPNNTRSSRYQIWRMRRFVRQSLRQLDLNVNRGTRDQIAVALSGGLAGMFGLPALPFELPISTVLIMRSIADIARSEGEDLGDFGTRFACMEVFALGGPTSSDDAVETGYFATRAALAKEVTEAAKFIAKGGFLKDGAPPLVKLIAEIAARFEVVVTEKIAAMAIPALGATLGASVNLIFISHYQQMARGHFIVRALERRFGVELVQAEYAALPPRQVSAE